MTACTHCGHEPRVGVLQRVWRPARPREERKVISILFADLMGSTALHEWLDPEWVNRVIDAYYRAVRTM